MCEYSGRLIAWLDQELSDQELSDQELPDQEATNVEWHVGHCAECRKAVSVYKEVSGAFLVCYEAAMSPRPRRRMEWWIASGVAAAALIVALVLFAQPRLEQLSMRPPSPPQAPAMAFEKSVPSPEPAVAVRPQRQARAPIHPRGIAQRWMAQEPVVEVALPADALFPPGAVPQGFSFIAEVRFQQ